MAERIKIKGSGIFRKYFLGMFLLLVVVFTVLGCLLMVFVANYWKNENIDLLSENVERIAKTAEEYFTLDKENGYKSPKVMLTYSLSLVSSSIKSDIFICTMDGKVIVCKDMQEGGSVFCPEHNAIHVPAGVISSASEGRYTHIGEISGLCEKNTLVVGAPIKINGSVVAVAFGTEPIGSNMLPYVSSITKLFAFATIVAFFVAAIFIYIITYSLTKPLRKMSKVTESYATGDFSSRIDVKGHDELATLAMSLNKMAKSLSALEYSRRSFVANVSHELKTPMTTIGGFIDGILDGTISPEEEEKYLKIVSNEVKRLSKLVVSMLNLSKIEAGELSLDKKNIDISALLFRTMLTFEKIIEEKHIDITGLDVLQSHRVNADEGLIGQVLYNLIDNAVKFTPRDGVINVRAAEDTESITLFIRNSGQGIPPDEIGKIFERFYKVDKSRSLDAKSTGLGLYIVKSIVEMHNGKIGAMSKEGQYTEFYFSLPL